MIAFLRELRSQHHALFVAGILITIANFGLWSNRISTRLVYADSAKVVSVFADGQQRVITTDANTVGDLLTRAGVVLNSGDIVEPAASTTLPAGYFNVNVYRAHPVVVVDGDKQYRLNTAYDSPRRAAEQAGLTLYPEDDFKVTTVTNFVDSGVVGDRIDVIRATPLTLQADGKTQVFRTQSKTVGQFLASINEPLGQKDVVDPAPSTPLSAGLDINITRVADVQTTVTEVIPKPVQQTDDPNLPKGQTVIKDPGADGQRVVTYHIRYNNGVEVERDVLDVSGQVAPKPEIVVVGTKVDFAGSVEYWRPFVTDAASVNGVDPNLMMAIMSCESNGNAQASNGSHFGLYQYDQLTWDNTGGGDVFDGQLQITRTAYKIAHYGTSAWAASKWCWGSKY